ncbi:MAG: hypothetical protein QNJ63_09085 [Calothrix sp. MO_192.B10]|nr:hypothetical protein [Calothrix sp. MO_192.B10]
MVKKSVDAVGQTNGFWARRHSDYGMVKKSVDAVPLQPTPSFKLFS